MTWQSVYMNMNKERPVVSKQLPGTVVRLTKARTVRTDIDDDSLCVPWVIRHPLNLNNQIKIKINMNIKVNDKNVCR